MFTFSLLGSISFLLVIAVMYLGVRLAKRHAWLLDHPTHRKNHEQATPLIGGVALILVLLPILSWLLPFGEFWPLLYGMLVLAALGIIDDIKQLPALVRLIVQVWVAVVVVLYGGLKIQYLGGVWGEDAGGLGVFAVPFTVLCIVFMINAVNMLDGMDGLAGSTVFLAVAAFALMGLLNGFGDFVLIQWLLLCALAGFLMFNLRTPWRPRALAFLGDGGSMMLGFWLAWSAIYLAQDGYGPVAPITVAFLLLFPAGDALAVFFRRAMRRQNPMKADKGHVHHILLRSGFSVSRVLLVLLGLQLLWLAMAFWFHYSPIAESLQFVLVTTIIIAYIVFVVSGRNFIRLFR